MAQVSRVPGPSSPLEGRTATVLTLVVLGVILAMLKPWGDAGPTARATATPNVSAAASTATPSSSDPLALYDHEVFGIREPAPNWELWPAGYLVSFGFAMRIDGTTAHSPERPASPSGSPLPSSSSGPDRDESEPIWPAAINLTTGSNLALIGINTPLGFRVSDVRLERLGPGGTSTAVPAVRIPSRWPTHFTVIGMDDGSGVEALDSWPPGRYRLYLSFEPGAISRTLDVSLEEPRSGPTPALAAPAPSPAGD